MADRGKNRSGNGKTGQKAAPSAGNGQKQAPETVGQAKQPTITSLAEQFGAEGAEIVREFIGEVAESVAAEAIERKIGGLMSGPAVKMALELDRVLESGTVGSATVLPALAEFLKAELNEIEAAIDPSIYPTVAPMLQAMERLSHAGSRQTAGLSHPPEIPAVRCDFCGHLFALNEPTYGTFHGPISVGEGVIVIDKPIRGCLQSNCLFSIIEMLVGVRDRLFTDRAKGEGGAVQLNAQQAGPRPGNTILSKVSAR
jgi:hypothetical protein